MRDSTKTKWFSAVGVSALILVPVGLVTAVLVGARGADPADSFAAPASTTQTSSTPQVSAPVVLQNPLNMTQQHDAMMDQMRVSVTATMNELMNRDPMWQMMRSTTLIADLEKHERDIDRMLGRGG